MSGDINNDIALEAFNQIIQAINDLSDKIDKSCGCGGSCHCNPEVDGPIAQDAAVFLLNCCTPDGFNTFSDYESYACRVSNWIADKLAIATKQMELIYFRFYEDYTGITQTSRLSVTQIYQRIAVALNEIVDQQIVFTIPNEDRSKLITLLTDRYVSFQDAVIAEVPETSTIDQVITEYWANPFGLPAANLETNLDTHKQAYFDQTSATTLQADIAANLATAAAAALGWATSTVADALDILATQGLANFKFAKNTIIDAYNATFACQGTLCTCPDVYVGVGTQLSSNTFQSVPAPSFPGRHDVNLDFNYDVNLGDYCGPAVAMTLTNIIGYSEWDPGKDFEVVDSLGNLVYQGAQPWPPDTVGSHVQILSSSQFQVTISWQTEGC